MPFTFAHPVVVLPFIRKRQRYISATGLIIGSIIPDFEGFAKLNDVKYYSHSIAGMFWLDLPMAVAFAYLFHYIIRNPLVYNLPGFLNKRFAHFCIVNWHQRFTRYWAVVLVSMLVGIATHLLLDSLTHINVVNTKCAVCILFNQDMTSLLQGAVTVIGLTYIAIYIWSLPAKQIIAGYRNRWAYWAVVAAGAALLLAVWYVCKSKDVTGSVKNVGNNATAFLLLSIIATSIFYKLFYPPPVFSRPGM